MFIVLRAILNLIYSFHKLFPIKNRIAIISRQAAKPTVDIKLLSKELKKQSPDTEIIVSCKKADKKIEYGFYVITKQMHLFATSKAVILDGYCICASVLRHKKRLKIFQMWHAMGALKSFGWGAVGKEEGRSCRLAKGLKMHKNYDVIFVKDKEHKKIMAEEFGYSSNVCKIFPLPRTDKILKGQKKAKEKILKKYDLAKKKTILYAPTFRTYTDITPFIEDLIRAVDYSRYNLIIKFHPVKGEMAVSDKAIVDKDFSTMKWLSVADYVITDYSAVYFEAETAGKPIVRYVPDLENYKEKRGLTEIFYNLKSPITKDAKEAIALLETANAQKNDMHYGNTKKIARYILGYIWEKQ